MKILTVDNNPQILKLLSDVFKKEGFTTFQASNGQDALNSYEKHSPDIICLDILMDDMSGYDVCREIRRQDIQTPIIFLSSKSQPFDKILGLELGADDYIAKPFDLGEVISRIRAVSRRCMSRKFPESVNESFMMHDLEVFPKQSRAKKGEEIIDLSLREIKILECFYQHKNEIITRDELLDYSWGSHIMPESRTVDMHVSKLRKRIESDHEDPKIIQTVHGQGYRFQDNL